MDRSHSSRVHRKRRRLRNRVSAPSTVIAADSPCGAIVYLRASVVNPPLDIVDVCGYAGGMTSNEMNDTIHEAVADWEAADDDVHAALYASSQRSAAFRHGFNVPAVTEARINAEMALWKLRLELADAGSGIAGR